MKNTIRKGCRVSFRRVNDSRAYVGTVKAIDSNSTFARAYGPQVTFRDSPFTVSLADCTPAPLATLATNGYLTAWIGDGPRGSLPCTLAQFLSWGLPLAALDNFGGHLVLRGPWRIPVSYRALCTSTVYTPENRRHWSGQTESETVHGMRTLTNCTQSGYALEGRVTVCGSSYSAFTSSQLFSVQMPDGSERLANVATIHARIPDAEQRAEINTRRAAGLLPVHVAARREPMITGQQWSCRLGYPVT